MSPHCLADIIIASVLSQDGLQLQGLCPAEVESSQYNHIGSTVPKFLLGDLMTAQILSLFEPIADRKPVNHEGLAMKLLPIGSMAWNRCLPGARSPWIVQSAS